MLARSHRSLSLVPFVLFAATAFGAVACGSEEGAPLPPAPSSGAAPEAPPAPPGTSGELTSGTAPTPPEPPICAEATGEYTATREPSNVLFLLDRSGSMHIELPDGTTRWASMENGLFDLLGELPSSTQAGAMMFPQGDAPVNAYCGIDASINDVTCTPGWPEPSQTARCSAGTYAVGVPSAALSPAQVSAIEAHVQASDAEFYWGTPLATSVTAAIDAQRASTLPGTRSVILLTDGNPTSCDEAGISNDVSHVVDAAAAGLTGTLVRTVVNGIVDGARQAAKAENLSPIAVAGGTARYPGCDAKNDCFYPVTQTSFASDLKKVFDEISVQAFDCTFNLPAASADTDPSKINVQLDDGSSKTSVARDTAHQDGWDYLPNGTQIQLYGQACTDAKASNAKLDIVLGCKTIVAPDYETR
jgi:hypothetical protein